MEGFAIEDGVLEGECGVVDFLAEGAATALVGAGEFAFEAALVGDEEAFFAIGVEVDAAVAFFEMGFGFEGAVGEEVESHGIGNRSAEGLYEIERERRAAIGGFVKEADGGIEADGVELRFGFCGEECVGVGKEGVGGVVRWAARASFKRGRVGKEAAEG